MENSANNLELAFKEKKNKEPEETASLEPRHIGPTRKDPSMCFLERSRRVQVSLHRPGGTSQNLEMCWTQPRGCCSPLYLCLHRAGLEQAR